MAIRNTGWWFVVLALASGGCGSEAPKAKAPAPPAWQLTTSRLSGSDAQLCDGKGEACKPLQSGTRITPPAVVKTGAGGRVALDGPQQDVYAHLGSHSEVSLAVNEGKLETRLKHGHLVLGRRVGAKAEAIASLGGQQVVPQPGAVVAARARAADRGVVTLRQGKALVSGDKGKLALRRGDTAHLVKGHAPDRRAVWRGEVAAAPVVFASLERPTTEVTGPARGFGRMSARIPGQEATVDGVRLTSHHVKVTIHDGFARTQVTEEFHNETDRVLEGRYRFPIPAGASISRLALWVGKELVEGEMVERDRAARIFKQIVDDTVRPRDPALLEWVSGGEFSLKIFPIEPKKSRKVLLSYNQALDTEGQQAKYVYPLSLGEDRETQIDDFSIEVSVHESAAKVVDLQVLGHGAELKQGDSAGGKPAATVRFSAKKFRPGADFGLSWRREATETKGTTAAVYVPGWASEKDKVAERSQGSKEGAYFAWRVTAELPEKAPPPTLEPKNRALVLDTSFSQGAETLQAQRRLVTQVLASLDPDESFVLLACDAACTSFPEQGLTPAVQKNLDRATSWLKGLKPGGASNVAGALKSAASRLATPGQIVMLTDGRASAGPLSAPTIAERAKPALGQHDVRFLGIGHTVDAVVMKGLASELGASYEPLTTGGDLEARMAQLTLSLQRPVVSNLQLQLPDNVDQVYPATLSNLRLGEEVTVVGRLKDYQPGQVVLTGTLGGKPYRLAKQLILPEGKASQNPLVPRLWAEGALSALQAADTKQDKKLRKEIVDLSRRHHVMSRYTSMLVLENEKMFAEFGVERLQRKIGEKPAAGGPRKVAADDSKAAMGNMWGDEIGDAFGAGGLGLSGIGEGGGGKGEGIGLGSIGQIGHGAGTGTGQGFGSGKGRLGGSHRARRPPKVRMGATSVSGRLPPEVIRRIVRQNFGRFRLCYENGLRNNPNLQGNVTVNFVIGRNGAVSNVANGGSSMPDAGVVSCVVRSFYGLSFPQPEGGIVTVRYPINFSPGDPGGGGGGGSRWTPPAAQRPIEKGTEKWRTAGEEQLKKLADALAKEPDSRKRHLSLVAGQLRHGRAKEALDSARKLATRDPDSAAARELFVQALVLGGQMKAAVAELASLAELEGAGAVTHQRIARAYDATADAARACAHWLAASELKPKDEGLEKEVERCTADKVAAHDPKQEKNGWLIASVTCDGPQEDCPVVLLQQPDGLLVSPYNPGRARSSGLEVGLFRSLSGMYRVLLVGGKAGRDIKVKVAADGSAKTFDIKTTGALQTVATVERAWGWGHGFGWGLGG